MAASSTSDVSRTASNASQPSDGDTILVVQPRWVNLILNGIKKLHICQHNLARQQYWIGCADQVVGKGIVVGTELIESNERWRELLPEHCWDRNTLPYTRTYALSLHNVKRIRPLPYMIPEQIDGAPVYVHGSNRAVKTVDIDSAECADDELSDDASCSIYSVSSDDTSDSIVSEYGYCSDFDVEQRRQIDIVEDDWARFDVQGAW